MIKKVVLGLSTRSNESLATLGTGVAKGITANPLLPSPPVTGANLLTAVEEFTTSYSVAKLTKSRKDWAQARKDRATVINMLRLLGNYVNLIAEGNEDVILSAGMNFTKTREKHPAPAQVVNFYTVFTGIPGSVQLVWDRPKFSNAFNVYMTTTPEDNSSWKLIRSLDTRKLMVQNLARGTRFYFKVVAVNAAGVSPDSEIADGLAA